jgi:hypothetical protein
MTKTLSHILLILFFYFLPSLSVANSIVIATFILMARFYLRPLFEIVVDITNGTVNIFLSAHAILTIHMRLCFVKGILVAVVGCISAVMEITKVIASESLEIMAWVYRGFLNSILFRRFPTKHCPRDESKEFKLDSFATTGETSSFARRNPPCKK